MSLRCVLEASSRPRGPLGASWVLRGASRGLLGISWEPLVGLLGASRGLLCASSWGLLGALLGALGALLGRSWKISIKEEEGVAISVAPREPPKIASWTHLGALLGPSWGSLEPLLDSLWGHLGAIVRPREAIESNRARRQNSLISFRFSNDFGFLGASVGGSVATWSRLGPVVGPRRTSWRPYWAILSRLGDHVGLSEAFLEPSWAILDAMTARGPAPPGPGGGGKEEG